MCVIARRRRAHHRHVRLHDDGLPHETGIGAAAVGIERRILAAQVRRARVFHGTAGEALVLDEEPELAIGFLRAGDRREHLVEGTEVVDARQLFDFAPGASPDDAAHARLLAQHRGVGRRVGVARREVVAVAVLPGRMHRDAERFQPGRIPPVTDADLDVGGRAEVGQLRCAGELAAGRGESGPGRFTRDEELELGLLGVARRGLKEVSRSGGHVGRRASRDLGRGVHTAGSHARASQEGCDEQA